MLNVLRLEGRPLGTGQVADLAGVTRPTASGTSPGPSRTRPGDMGGARTERSAGIVATALIYRKGLLPNSFLAAFFGAWGQVPVAPRDSSALARIVLIRANLGIDCQPTLVRSVPAFDAPGMLIRAFVARTPDRRDRTHPASVAEQGSRREWVLYSAVRPGTDAPILTRS